jgi:16S rRNA (guanine(527)-N(7))-methyltransferase RsmG
MTSFLSVLQRRLSESRYRISDEIAERLRSHWELLLRWNRRLNLTAITETEEAVVRHYCESIALAQEIPGGAWRIVDLGSGGGFPGFVIALIRPECRVLLVERDTRKSIFLKEASQGIPNISIELDAEGQERDLIVSRGVSWRELAPIVGFSQLGLLVSQEQELELTGLKVLRRHKLPWKPFHLCLIGQMDTTYSPYGVSRGTS